MAESEILHYRPGSTIPRRPSVLSPRTSLLERTEKSLLGCPSSTMARGTRTYRVPDRPLAVRTCREAKILRTAATAPAVDAAARRWRSYFWSRQRKFYSWCDCHERQCFSRIASTQFRVLPLWISRSSRRTFFCWPYLRARRSLITTRKLSLRRSFPTSRTLARPLGGAHPWSDPGCRFALWNQRWPTSPLRPTDVRSHLGSNYRSQAQYRRER